MTSGFMLGPGEGSAHGFHGSAVVIKASGEHTLGQLGVMESAYPPGLSVREHVHAGEDEMFYLLEGELAVFCGEEHWTVSAGSFVFVPRDSPHGFTVTGGGPARALVITGPSRLDGQIAARAEAVPPGLLH
jgi:quercetin dioxygenase-like cupin family protein